jgi:hypothetical protein
MEAPKHLMKSIVFSCYNETLKIQTNQQIYSNNIKIKINLSSLDDIYLVENSYMEGFFNSNQLTIHADGESEIHLTGEVKNLNVETFGEPVIDLSELIAENAHVNLIGNCDLTLYCKRNLIGNSVGSSKIKVLGTKNVFVQTLADFK